MKSRLAYILLAAMIVGLAACEKDPVIPPTTFTNEDMFIYPSYTEADITWTFDCDAEIDNMVCEYATDSTFVGCNERNMDIINGWYSTTEKTTFNYRSSVSLNELARGTTYYFRIKGKNNYSAFTSKTHSFKTRAYANQAPVVRTDPLGEVLATTVQANATLMDWGSDKRPILGFCYATHPDVSINDNVVTVTAEDWKDVVPFSQLISNLSDNTTYYLRAFAMNDKGTGYGEELSFTTIVDFVSGLFSVSATKKVRFSKGNLQYHAWGSHLCSDGSSKKGAWRFANHQYDIIGSANAFASANYWGWIDLFGYGTSGNYFQPYSTSIDKSDYRQKNIAGTIHEWGYYNAISNGGNTPGMWRTLTDTEWSYLLKRELTNGSTKTVTVKGVPGIILLPDDFVYPEGTEGSTYDNEQWILMELAGVVFLPAAGNRKGTNVGNVHTRGYYWSSTYDEYLGGKEIVFNVDGSAPFSSQSTPYYGQSVRLVQDAY